MVRLPMLLLVACSHPTAASLHAPVHGWEHKVGLCGNQYALDGDGVLWTEGGCENGVPELSRVRELGADAIRRVTDAFAHLPAPAPQADCGDVHVFWIRTAAGERRWYVCAPDSAHGTLSADPLPAPYAEAARALEGR